MDWHRASCPRDQAARPALPLASLTTGRLVEDIAREFQSMKEEPSLRLTRDRSYKGKSRLVCPGPCWCAQEHAREERRSQAALQSRRSSPGW